MNGVRENQLCFQLSFLQFKSTSSKNVCVVGLMAMMADDPEHPDVFLLTDSEHGEAHRDQCSWGGGRKDTH